ncbi:MAG TPA: hypothetical protein EYP17_07385, partial [Candidatus Latescibacteria bacterium]|nr:hypothetical protein [Candidatus Latescibacterota bacterium]
MTEGTSNGKLRRWTEELKASVRREASAFDERDLLAAEAFRQTEGEPFRILRVAHATSRDAAKTRGGSGVLEEAELLGERLRGTYGPGLSNPPEAGHRGGFREYRANGSLDPVDPEAPQKRAFYQAARMSLVAFRDLILRYAELARRMEKEAEDPDWREELEKIAEICEHISSDPPRNFREAIQLAWFTFLAVAVEAGTSHHCFGPGHIDRYLLPFYRREKGELQEEVEALLDQLFVKCNEFSGPNMSALIIGVAGRNPDGTDATNELSYKCFEASDRVRMYFPGVDVLWHKDIDEEFMRAACRLLRNGAGHPSFFNSDLIIRGLMKYGVLFEHAVDHLPSTCTETSIQGRTNPWVAWPYVNILMCLLYALFNGRHPIEGTQDTPATGVTRTYRELKEAFFKQLEHAAHKAIAQGIRDQTLESWYRPFPLLSCFIQDCIGRGRDISHGGALYNFLQPEAVGVSNVVDGLAAIKTLVEDRRRYTLDDFRNAVVNDFEGCEELRRAIQDCPKHGNNISWVDELFAEVAGRWCSAIEGHRNLYGGPVLPGFLGWTVWIGF